MSTYELMKPLDDDVAQTLDELSNAAEQLGIRTCLIGAQARVIWLEHVHGMRADRATQDTDFAVHIDDWDQFESLGTLLMESFGWRKDGKQAQRFYSAADRMVDLVPCGDVAEEDAITWPPDHSHRMDVRGFELAMSEGVHIEYDEGREVTIAPLHVLVLLKLVSWWDRASGQEKDAEDLAALLRSYADTDADRLLELDEHIDLYELEDDHECRGARLAGRLIGVAAEDHTLELAMDILEVESDADGDLRLALQCSEALPGDEDKRIDRALDLLSSLRDGIDDSLEED